MEAPLSHRDAQKMFFAWADDELVDADSSRLRLHLDGCEDCRRGWERYEQTVKTLRRTTREKAPPHLSTQIMRRVRRERLFGFRRAHLANIHYRVPVESVIPVMLGIAVAVWLMFAA